MTKSESTPAVLISIPEQDRSAFEPLSDERIETALEEGRVARCVAQANAQSVAPIPHVLLR
jgi:hypothetical protein